MRIVDKYSERNSSSTTILPPSAGHLTGENLHPKLKPLCPKRMAEADAADAEVAALCEELSQVMRKMPHNKTIDARPARGVSNRPSVRRRPVRKAPRA